MDSLRCRYRRMLHEGVTSVLEKWGESGSWRDGVLSGFRRTHSHARSACPATALVSLLGGIAPVEPGGAIVRIVPWAAPFTYRVVRRFAAGTVAVEWDGSVLSCTASTGISVQHNDTWLVPKPMAGGTLSSFKLFTGDNA